MYSHTVSRGPMSGRRRIVSGYVDQKYEGFGYPVIHDDVIPTIIQTAINTHTDNVSEMCVLRDYYDGNHNILYRGKEIRPDINNRIVVGLPKSSTDLLVGYFFSKPLTYTPRDDLSYDTITDLNTILDDLGAEKVNQDVLEDMCIYGLAYKLILPDVNELFSPHKVLMSRLDPMNTFVIESQMVGAPPLMAVHVSEYAKDGGDFLTGATERLVTVYMNYRTIVFRQPTLASLDWSHVVSDTSHLSPIPVVKYELNNSRQGLYEQALTIVDAIELLLSDGVNDVAQTVQAILVALNAEFDEELLGQVREDKFVQLFSPTQGTPADLKYVVNPVNPANIQFLLDKLETLYSIVINGATRTSSNAEGGQDTGKAQLVKSGYHSMEMISANLERTFEKAERESLVLLKNIFTTTHSLDFDICDIEIKFSRNKAENVGEKASAMRNLIDSGIISPVDAIELADLTTDPLAMAQRGQAYAEEKAEQALTTAEAQAQITASTQPKTTEE